MLANTFFRDDTPSSAEDAFVGADGNDGVHVRTGDIFASAERVQGSLVVGVLVARFEVGDLGAAKDGLKGQFDEELGCGSKECSERVGGWC